jgi:hypothetical protein
MEKLLALIQIFYVMMYHALKVAEDMENVSKEFANALLGLLGFLVKQYFYVIVLASPVQVVRAHHVRSIMLFHQV